MKKVLVLVTIAVIALFFACKKGAGEGGRAFIKGKIFVRNFTNPPCPCFLKEEYYGQGEQVYIVYGDEPGVGDNVRCSYDGSFQFSYLRKGKYKVFALSKDTLSITNGKTIEALKEVEITKANQTLDIGTITVIK